MIGTIFCGAEMYSVVLPDAGEGACCIGAAFNDAQHCTCWRPVYDRRQRQALRAGPPVVRAKACADCAYRPESPERAGADGYACNDGELDGLVLSDRTPFFCHQGMRRTIRLRHPSGAEVEAHPGAYSPPMTFIPMKANGQPGDLCAGWAARRAQFEAGRI